MMESVWYLWFHSSVRRFTDSFRCFFDLLAFLIVVVVLEVASISSYKASCEQLKEAINLLPVTNNRTKYSPLAPSWLITLI